ncbi:MAG: NADH-quinone oxidoreductase subunit NuoE [Rickettsiaceae bacterium]|nr:NADH-quinone oxidoreductase subunit NuoE [Rickettsiaceae bacterium]
MNSTPFSFTKENLTKVQEILSHYPPKRQHSAILPLLDLAQRQNEGYLNQQIIEYVADIISMPYVRAYEVATFYTMLNLEPVGKYHIQICGTPPCWLRGAKDIIEACRKELHIDLGQTTEDGIFSLSEVECVGACVNAPVVQINDDYYEDISVDIMKDILIKLKAGKKIKIGSQIGRQNSAPIGYGGEK